MAYKSGHIYMIDHEPNGEELANFSKPVQFDICKNGLYYSILYDKNGNKYVEDRSLIVTGFIKIGEIVQDGSQITIGVHPSGFNHWRINGVDITRSTPITLQVDAVPDGQFRIDNLVGTQAGGIFILPGTAGKFPIGPNPLDYPNFAFFLEIHVTPDGLGGIVELNLSNVFTGDGANQPLDVKQASSDERGTMSPAHWQKLEGINLLNYATIQAVSDKLDKISTSAQTVASAVTFSGNVSTPKLILQVQSANTTVGAIWSDGQSAYYNGSGGTAKPLMYDESGTFTGNVIPLNYITGAFNNSANSSTVYTTSNLKRGGWAIVLINAPSEPSVTGGIKIAGNPFSINLNMYMVVRYNGNNVEYFFSRI